MRHAISICPAVSAAVVLLAGSPALADPVTLRPGFVLLRDEPDEPADFALIGPGFQLTGDWFPRTLRGTFWSHVCGHPQLPGGPAGCLPGSRIDFGTTTYAVSADQLGSGVIGGVTHEHLFYRGEWTFTGPVVTGPEVLDEGLISGGRFEFQGTIFAFLNEERAGTPLFSADLRGSGTAHVSFRVEAGGAGDRLIADDIGYAFETPQPVPEPSSVLLVAAGLAAGINRVRRRRVR